MERAVLLKQLEEAKKRADQTISLVTLQKQGIETMTAAGVETAEAERLLQTLEEKLSYHLAHLQRILNALDDKDPSRDIRY